MSSKYPVPDTEAIYDLEIAPLITQIIAIARRCGMPFVASFKLSEADADGRGPLFCSTAICPMGTDPRIIEAIDLIRSGVRPQALALTFTTPVNQP